MVECEASFGYLKACFVITVDPFFVAQRQKQRRQQHVIWLLVALITVAVTIALSSLSTIVRELLIAIVTTAVAVVTIVVIVDQRSIGFVHHLWWFHLSLRVCFQFIEIVCLNGFDHHLEALGSCFEHSDRFDLGQVYHLDFVLMQLKMDYLHLVFVIAFCTYSRWLKNLEDWNLVASSLSWKFLDSGCRMVTEYRWFFG